MQPIWKHISKQFPWDKAKVQSRPWSSCATETSGPGKAENKVKFALDDRKEPLKPYSSRGLLVRQLPFGRFYLSSFLISKQDGKNGTNNLIVSVLLPHFLCAIWQYLVSHPHISTYNSHWVQTYLSVDGLLHISNFHWAWAQKKTPQSENSAGKCVGAIYLSGPLPAKYCRQKWA